MRRRIPIFLLAAVLLGASGLLLDAVARTRRWRAAAPTLLSAKGGFMLLALHEPGREERGDDHAPYPLILPFRSWLWDRDIHLVTSVHHDLAKARADALWDHLGTVLVPTLRIEGTELRRIAVRIEAIDARSGRAIAVAQDIRPIPPGPEPAAVAALLPAMVDQVYRRLFDPRRARS